MTLPEDVPQDYVDQVRTLLMKLSGYRADTCSAVVVASFEGVARTACAMMIDEEKARHDEA